MEEKIHVGMNKTGVQTAPIQFRKLMDGLSLSQPSSTGGEPRLTAVRREYALEAESIGTVPIPGSAQGMTQTLLQKLKGNNPTVLLDKIAERIAFERTGTRLYDLLLVKCNAYPDEFTSVGSIQKIRDDEARHFQMLVEVMKNLGGDPTAQTPCADISGVMAQGLVQVLSDPRTSLAQAFEAILFAELGDNDAWELLTDLVDEYGLDEIASQFRNAKLEEEEHVREIRALLRHHVSEGH